MGDNTVVPIIFLVLVFIWSQIGLVLVFRLVSFPPFCIVPPFFLERGAGLLKKRAIAPLLRKKGGNCPLFDTKNVPTEFSFGIGMVITKKY